MERYDIIGMVRVQKGTMFPPKMASSMIAEEAILRYETFGLSIQTPSSRKMCSGRSWSCP